MDTVSAEAELNRFLDRQASKVQEDRAGQQAANRRAAELKRVEQQRTTRMHQENKALWHAHYIRMAHTHHDLAAEYAAKADQLNGDDAA